MYEKLSDNELIALHQSGDAEAFPVILERYKELVKSIARSYFLVGGDRDDLVQEGVLGLLKAVNTFDKERGASFKTFVYRCVSASIQNAVKKSLSKGNMPLNDSVELTDELKLVSPFNPEEILLIGERGRALNDGANAALSELEFKILRYYLAGMTYGEIGKLTGRSAKSADNALQRIKKKLIKIIGEGDF